MALPKKKSSRQSGDETKMENPYLQARGVWLERYGTYVSQAYNWRLIAILESIALVTAIVGLIYTAGQSKFVPYIVAVDKVGMALGIHPAPAAAGVDERVIHAQLASFIIKARSVTVDRLAQKAAIESVYNMVLPDSPARSYLDAWYPTASPFVRMQHGTVQIQITQILKVSPTSYTVQWEENSRDLTGNANGKETWEGTFGVAFRPPSSADESLVLTNPAGLYILNVTWTKKL